MDRKTGKLVESRPKVLYEQMPVIYIYAINTTAGKDSKLYECPIYRKPARYADELFWVLQRHCLGIIEVTCVTSFFSSQ